MAEVPEALREAFRREVRRRFRQIRGAFRRWVGYEEDVFGLAQDGSAATRSNDLPDGAPKVYRFQTDAGKIAAFMNWYRTRLDEDVLEPRDSKRVRNGEHWTAEYIREAYSRGWQDAHYRLQQEGVNVGSLPGGEEESVIEGLFNLPASRRALQELYTRTYENLDSVTADAAEPVRETLTTGLDEGWNPRKTASKLTREVRTVQHTQAEVLARTETVNAYTESSLDRYERAGVDSVSVSGEILTANDARVCPICEHVADEEHGIQTLREGSFTFEPSEDDPDHLAGEFPLRPPIHPQCRCTVVPVVE